MATPPCLACGNSAELGDQFCSACGAALTASPGSYPVDDRAGASPDAGDGGPELLFLEPMPTGPAVPDGSARRRSPARMWLLAAAGVLAVAVGLWGLTSTGSGPPGHGSPAEPGETARPRPTMASPGTGDETVDGDGPAGGSDTTAATGGSDTVPVYDPDSGLPVLGRPVGWSLLIGDQYQGDLERLDLDTGGRVVYDGVAAAPVAALEGLLLLQTDTEGEDGEFGTTLRAVPLDDPAAPGVELLTVESIVGGRWPVEAAGDGELWIYASTAEVTSWRLVRLRDGKLIDEEPAPSFFRAFPVPGGGPEVATSASGGVFRRGTGGYRLVGPGRLHSVDQGAALVTTCSSPADCQLQWLDVDSGQPVERPLPADSPGVGWVGVIDDAARFLMGWRSTSTNGFAVTLFDSHQGRLIEIEQTSSGLTGELAASPDGRFLAFTTNRGLNLYDADEDRWIAVGGVGFGGDAASLLFVPNGNPR